MIRSLSPIILAILTPFAILFHDRSWPNALTLLVGAILCKGKRTVCSVLRALGKAQESGFSKFHRILNRTSWSALQGSAILLSMIIRLAVGSGLLVIMVDETLERRKGKKIKAKGCYRDAVRSSHSHVVTAFGLKWIVMAVSVRFPFAKRAFALPFFTVLEPSEKSVRETKRRHRTTVDWACIMVRQLRRWIPKTPFVLVGDGGFASGRLAWLCHLKKVALISRLKINAALYNFAPPREAGQKGRPRTRGERLLSFTEILKKAGLPWRDAEVIGYAGEKRSIRYLENTALWGVEGSQPVPIRWILVTDPSGQLAPLPLLCTDVTLSAEKIIQLYVDRWGLEVTFEEVREHLGVESQRQWSDKAVARTTPTLMALYSLVCLMAQALYQQGQLGSQSTAWYAKNSITFSDCLMAVRRLIWRDSSFFAEDQSTAFLGKSPPEIAQWLASIIDYLAATA